MADSNKEKIRKADENEAIHEGPPMTGEFANWAGVNQSDLQTIVDFGFIQPTVKGDPKRGIIFRRIVLPPKVAEELGKILSKGAKKMKKPAKEKKNKSTVNSRLRSWEDLKEDREQQKIYRDNVNFIADLHSKYGCK